MPTTIIFLSLLMIGSVALAQSSESTTQMVLPEGPLQVTVTGVDGIVRVRPTSTDKWVRASVGMVLNEGAEFQTGPRSAVRFVIPPDQTVSLDRLGTVKILRANFENGKLFTDLGMKYGRTRYDIESAGRDHDAKVHSPSAVMAVRGTTVSLYDQPPFTPQAVSLTGRARFISAGKTIPFGGKGQGETEVDQTSDSAAQAALVQTQLDPKGAFSGRTQTDLNFQLAQAAFAGTNFASVGVVSAVVQPGVKINPVPPTPPTPPPPVLPQQLLISLGFQDDAVQDINIDFKITDPLGEVLSAATPTTADGGVFAGMTVSASTLQANISAYWRNGFPSGNYVFSETFLEGPPTQTGLVLTDFNPNTKAQVNIGPIMTTLGAASPTFLYPYVFPAQGAAPAGTVPARAERVAEVPAFRR
jgi:hypothetical protein